MMITHKEQSRIDAAEEEEEDEDDQEAGTQRPTEPRDVCCCGP